MECSEVKFFEVRDTEGWRGYTLKQEGVDAACGARMAGTREYARADSVFAVNVCPASSSERHIIHGMEPYLLPGTVYLIWDGKAIYEPRDWAFEFTAVTMGLAHKYITENFDKLKSGQVIDVARLIEDGYFDEGDENEYIDLAKERRRLIDEDHKMIEERVKENLRVEAAWEAKGG